MQQSVGKLIIGRQLNSNEQSDCVKWIVGALKIVSRMHWFNYRADIDSNGCYCSHTAYKIQLFEECVARGKQLSIGSFLASLHELYNAVANNLQRVKHVEFPCTESKALLINKLDVGKSTGSQRERGRGKRDIFQFHSHIIRNSISSDN